MKAAISIIFLFSFLFQGLAVGSEKPAAPELEEGSTVYLSAGRKIRVETFIPTGIRRYPAVLVLYGSGGALMGKGEMVDFARQFARGGAAVFLVHYFDRTGTIMVIRDGPIHRHQAAWTDAVRDAVSFVQTHPRVRKGPVELFGYSLGAYLAVTEAARDPRIGAVAELSGGIFDEVRPDLKRFPPLLILHGRLDQRVPIRRAFDLQKTWLRSRAKPQLHIYENEGHRLSKGALVDVGRRAVQFFRAHFRF